MKKNQDIRDKLYSADISMLTEQLKDMFPIGTKIELVHMDDAEAPKVGTIGIVTGIDEFGDLEVDWANGSTLKVLQGVDTVRKAE